MLTFFFVVSFMLNIIGFPIYLFLGLWHHNYYMLELSLFCLINSLGLYGALKDS